MGKFKEKEMEKQNPLYGAAIIEVRGIRDIDEWFLNSDWYNFYEPKPLKSHFLTSPEKQDLFLDQAMGLFRFLKKFNLDSFGIRKKILTSITKGVSNANKESPGISITR